MSYQPRKNLLTSVFGENVSVEPTPIIQISNQYAIDPPLRDDLEVFEATGGSSDSLDNMFRCQSGTSVGGYGVIRSKEVAVYKPGQGIEARFTAAFTTGIALSLQFGGLFSLTETLAIGYDGADFSCIHEYDGEAEVQLITVTVTGAGTCTVTLDGTASSGITVTNSDVQTNAEEIRAGLAADALNNSWRFEQVDDKVYCIARSVGDKTGTMSISGGVTANIAEQTAGQAKTSNNTAQASWNITTTPFTGFDPTMLNLYRIEYGYLGAVSAVFSIYNSGTGEFVPVHRIEWANNNTTPIFGNPDLKIGWTSASLGASGTNLTVTGASAYVAVGGKSISRNQSYGTNNTVSSVGGTLTPLITVKNRIVYGDRFNLGKLEPVIISVNNDHTKGAVVEIYKNATLTGGTNYQYEEENNSIALIDKSATGISGGALIDSFTIGAGLNESVDLSKLFIELLPEETLTVASFAVATTATSHTGAITWIEEK